MVSHTDLTSRLATQEVQEIAGEFADLASPDQVTGLAFVAVSTAAGVSIAQQLVDLVVPRLPEGLGVNKDPQRARDFLTAGVLQGLWAVLLMVGSVKLLKGDEREPKRPFLFASAIGLAIGAVAISGANLVEFLQRVFGGASEQFAESEVWADTKARFESTEDSADESAPALETPGPAEAAAGQPAVADGGVDREIERHDRHWEARAGSMAVPVNAA